METIKINQNEEQQRLDRFLRKYLKNAPLSYVYKAIRKDVKVNGRRVKEDYILAEGDEIQLYMSTDELSTYLKPNEREKSKRQFRIAYEDENLIVVEKPFGLLTHGDQTEKKNTLANQVLSYLIETEAYVPRMEKTFVPSPVNRLDRNTTGLVIFGKNGETLMELNRLIREREAIRKFYVTIVAGEMKAPLQLKDYMLKDARTNTVEVAPRSRGIPGEKSMETLATPKKVKKGFSLVEIELVTGRTHQIRAHLAQAGFPVIGDPKYGRAMINEKIRQRFHWSAQVLHATRLVFQKMTGPLAYLEGLQVEAPLPDHFQEMVDQLFEGVNG
jgi:23S rRNA pseudouridine955/2504/2580 synthase